MNERCECHECTQIRNHEKGLGRWFGPPPTLADSANEWNGAVKDEVKNIKDGTPILQCAQLGCPDCIHFRQRMELASIEGQK